MTAAFSQPQKAAFGWEDALPKDEDDLQMLLAKYARLRFIFQVHRL